MIWGSKKSYPVVQDKYDFLLVHASHPLTKWRWARSACCLDPLEFKLWSWLIYRETDLKIHFSVLYASLLPFKPSLSFLNQAKKKKERNQRVIYKKKSYITSPLNTRKCCPKLQHPLIIQSCSHEMNSKWEEEKSCQPIKSTWWRTVMIRKELEEMGKIRSTWWRRVIIKR